MTITNDDVHGALREVSMLADVTIGVWSGEAQDKDALAQVADANNATTRNIGRMVKNLMAGADTRLKDTRSAFFNVRSVHNAMTMPWGNGKGRTSGARLLANAHTLTYLDKMGTAKKQAMEALDRMLDTYDTDVVTASAALGGLAPSSYPTADEVRSMFYITLALDPLPAGSQFRNLPAAYASKLSEALHKRQGAMFAAARNFMWDTLRERLGSLAERLADPEAVFRTALLENAMEAVNQAPGWNLDGDMDVVNIVIECDAVLQGVTATRLRDDPAKRAQVARDLTAVVAKFPT